MKLSFYLNNIGIKDIDCSQIETGNPGIGGSEFAIILLAHHLSKKFNAICNLILYAEETSKLPSSITTVKVNDVEDAIRKASNSGHEIFIMRHNLDFDIYNSDAAKKLKFIIWCHNFIEPIYLNKFVRQANVKCLVCVGREQLDEYRDHEAFKKSTFIYNAIPLKSFDYYNNTNNVRDRKKNVTYIGNLIPTKGFHLLAEAWPQIIKEIPEARLNVIGTGKLYNRNSQLGEYGIAEKQYESSFIKYLIDSDMKIIPSVNFHGILGNKKEDILFATKVGVPNPSGKSETFGYTALEMQLYGAFVTSKKCPGYMDTFFDKKNLYKRNSDLAKNIIASLNYKENNLKKTYNFINNNFSLDVVSLKWLRLFFQINENRKIKNPEKLINLYYNLKFFREYNRRFKKNVPFGKYLPTIKVIERSLQKVVNRFKIYSK